MAKRVQGCLKELGKGDDAGIVDQDVHGPMRAQDLLATGGDTVLRAETCGDRPEHVLVGIGQFRQPIHVHIDPDDGDAGGDQLLRHGLSNGACRSGQDAVASLRISLSLRLFLVVWDRASVLTV
ncbi:MAG: hypothetical protein AAGF79_02370 [Pseudomonadota bacterium]